MKPQQRSEDDRTIVRRALREARLLRSALEPGKPLSVDDGFAPLAKDHDWHLDRMSDSGVTKG